jgi:hypothetical protein
MAAKKDPKSPATTSAAYDRMSPRWALMNTLLAGTEAMRAAGEAFCPKHTQETDQNYQNRLQSATLLNMVEQTLDTLSGKPFCEPIKINDDVPKAITDKILYDVDLQGNNLDVFARQWFREGMAKAFCHVLVDMPKPAAVAKGKKRTLADDRKEGLRPYWVMVKPECVLFARSEIIDGSEVLLHVRIAEVYTEQDGFAEVEKVRIRILEPGSVELWEPHPTKKANGDPVWIKVDEWATSLSYIPLVTFYANREGFMEGKPPLLDQAYMNVTHWQSTADQRHILTVARFPILACSGASADDSDPVVVGPDRVLYNEDPQGRFYYVEHTGTAIEAGRNDLKDLQEQMAGYGAEFLKQKTGSITATSHALDSAEASSDLAAMSGLFEDAVAQALDITAEWMKLSQEGGSIELIKDYGIGPEGTANLDQLQKARAAKEISRKAYLNGLILYGVLPEDFDMEEDEQALLDEQTTALGRSMFDLNPGAPDAGNPPPGSPAPAPPTPPAKKPASKKTAAKKAA